MTGDATGGRRGRGTTGRACSATTTSSRILEEAIADERAAQEKYRRGLERCADPEACAVFEQLLREEQAHERVLEARYVEVKKRIGLQGRPGAASWRQPSRRSPRARRRRPASAAAGQPRLATFLHTSGRPARP